MNALAVHQAGGLEGQCCQRAKPGHSLATLIVVAGKASNNGEA
jgi:hypothetical protein